MFSFSTAWNADRLLDGEKIVREIYELGFKQIELNFSLSHEMVEDARRFIKAHGITVSSLHNYCPTPKEFKREDALPDCYSLSALDENERLKAVAATQTTIDTARTLGARAVVLHTGRVEMQDRTRQLISLAVQGQKDSAAYKEIFNAFKTERLAKSPGHFQQIMKSLEELEGYAGQHDIRLGVENRFYFREIPSLDEFEQIFERFKKGPIGYWHDVGHAYIFEELGFLKPDILLERFGHRLIGMHLHNVKNLVDHQAPIEGTFDFKRLKKYMRPDTIKVLEIHKQASGEEIKRSVAYLSEILP